VAVFEGRDAADGLGVDEVFLGDQAGCAPFCLEITTAGLGFHRVLDAVAAEEQIARLDVRYLDPAAVAARAKQRAGEESPAEQRSEGPA
jgi:hypothetical protein